MSLALILALGRWRPRGSRGSWSRSSWRPSRTETPSRRITVCPWLGTLPQGFPPATAPSPVSDLPLLVAGAIGIALGCAPTSSTRLSTASVFAARTGLEESMATEKSSGSAPPTSPPGLLPGLPGEHERLTHGGRRAGRGQDSAHRSRRRRAIVVMLVLVPGLLGNRRTDPRRSSSSRRRCRLRLPRSLPRYRPAVATTPGRVPAVPDRVPRCGALLASWRGSRSPSHSESPQRLPASTWRPYQTTLGRRPGAPGQHHRQLHPWGRGAAGPGHLPLRRLRLFFAQTPHGRSGTTSPRSLRPARGRTGIVVAAEPITDVDTTAAEHAR